MTDPARSAVAVDPGVGDALGAGAEPRPRARPSTRAHDPRTRHHPVIDLRTAAPTAHPALQSAVAAASRRLVEFQSRGGYDPAGLPELRTALAARYCRSGVPTDPDEILVTSGAQHGLNLLFHTLLQPGDRVAVEDPTYPNALALLQRVGAHAVGVPMSRTGVDVDALEAVFRQSAPRLAYVMPDHHNPTGATLHTGGRTRLTELAASYGVRLVSDDTLREVIIDADPPPPLGGLGAGDGAEVIHVGSASKLLWGGLRVGWVRAPAELVTQLARARAVVDLSSPVLEQLVTLELLSGTDSAPDLRRLLRGRRDLLVESLHERAPSWTTNRPSGGLALWVDVGQHRERSVVCLAAAHGLLVAGGSAFAVEAHHDRFIRVAFAQPAAALTQAADVLGRVHDAVVADRSLRSPVTAI